MTEQKRRGRPPKESPEVEDEVKAPEPPEVEDEGPAPKDEPKISDLLVEVKKPRNLTREAIVAECGDERAFEMIPE